MAEERHCSECGGKLPADAPQGLCPQCLMKLGLPTGAEADKKDSPDDKRAIPTSATPPGGFVPPEPAELARQFPQLEILELLGQGGMGAVYKARQKQLDRLVALKILPPEIGQTEAFAERFTREARSMAKLNHQHVVTLHEFGKTDDGLYFFLMEFVDGTDLRRVIQAGELSPNEALAIVPQICEALQYAHEEGIVHRDIKPENVLLDKKGRVKIADFGLARLLDRPASTYTLTQAGQRMGTPHYMAPEQIEHPHEVDHRADIYSLGVVFYEMLTGQLPIGKFAPPSTKVQVDVRLDRVVLKSLEYEPERRYQHASEVKTDVEIISAGAGQQAEQALKDGSFSPWFWKQPWFLKLPKWQRWAALLLLFMLGPAYVVISVLTDFKLDITPALLLGVFVVFCGGSNAIVAWRFRGTRCGWHAALVSHAILVFTIGWVVVAAEPTINLLYRQTGSTPSGHDVAYVRFLLLLFMIWPICSIIHYWRKLGYGAWFRTPIRKTLDPPMSDQEAAVRLGPHKEPGQQYQQASKVKTDVESIASEAGGAPPKERGESITEAEAALVRQSRATKISVAIVYCIILTAWVLMPYGMFDKQGLLDIKHWELFAVSASLAWVVWFLLRRSDVKAAFRLKPKYRKPEISTMPQGLDQQAREVKTDVETITAESKPAAVYAPKTPTARRFSRAAIVGACWAPLALLLLVPQVTEFLLSERELGPGEDVSLPFYVVLLALLGLSSPFGTTILGFISISHTRRSAGRLYGMEFALVDALLFPLLGLDALIFVVCVLVARIPAVLPLPPISFAALVALPICAVADLLVARWAWRKANEGLHPSTAAAELSEAEAIQQQVKRPAIALLIAGIITLASGPITGLWILAEYRLVDSWEVGDWRLGTTVLTIWLIAQAVAITIAALVIAAALNMKRLKSRGLALAAAILAMIPLTLAWLFSLPIAIWVLSVISRREVKDAFPQRPIDLSKQGKWNAFCIAALPISLVGIFFSIREMDPGEDVAVRIIWALSIAISVVFAGIGLWQHSKYQGMRGKGFGIAALVVALAALIGFVVTIYYPVGW